MFDPTFSPWVARVKTAVRANWSGAQLCKGIPVFNLEVAENGALRDIELAKSSGDRYCDESAERAIRKSDPLPAPPRGALALRARHESEGHSVTRPFLVLFLLLAIAVPAHAQRIRVDVSGSGRAIPVAVQRFSVDAASGPLSEEFFQGLVAGLDFSSVVTHVNPEAFVESKVTRDFEVPAVPCENWRAIGADGLVQGEVHVVRARCRRATRSGTRSGVGSSATWRSASAPRGSRSARARRRRRHRRALHRAARRGVDADRVRLRHRPGNKQIWVMEANGAGKRAVTSNRSINLFPAWSADGRTLVYTSFKTGTSEICTLVPRQQARASG